MPSANQSATDNLPVSDVQKQIQDAITPITDSEKIDLSGALNRILAADVVATIDVPAFDNAAMDGYAFSGTDAQQHQLLKIVGRSYAGHPFSGPLQAGQAIRITTGAPVPLNADTILPHELAVLTDDNLLDVRPVNFRTGQNRRRRGEDIAKGSVGLHKGTRLSPAELGLLASLGVPEVQVQRRLRVAIFSTGDELRTPGQAMNEGGVFDSNRISLGAMLTLSGAEVIDLGVLIDDPAEIESALRKAAQDVDVIITSGGVSAGDADYTKQVMQRLGQMNFWSVNMRPGRPLAFGQIRTTVRPATTYIFGLPGNPVAMMVSFYFFVRPALQLLSGTQVKMPPQIPAIATEAMPKKIGRTEFQRGICKLNAEGQMTVSSTGMQGSGMLSSMTQANCLIVLPSGQGAVSAGDRVHLVLFDGLI